MTGRPSSQELADRVALALRESVKRLESEQEAVRFLRGELARARSECERLKFVAARLQTAEQETTIYSAEAS